jgi:hypothetical protein
MPSCAREWSRRSRLPAAPGASTVRRPAARPALPAHQLAKNAEAVTVCRQSVQRVPAKIQYLSTHEESKLGSPLSPMEHCSDFLPFPSAHRLQPSVHVASVA